MLPAKVEIIEEFQDNITANEPSVLLRANTSQPDNVQLSMKGVRVASSKKSGIQGGLTPLKSYNKEGVAAYKYTPLNLGAEMSDQDFDYLEY